MSVGFHHIGYSAETCGMCHYQMDDVQDVEEKGGVVIHGGEQGKKHPFHRECFKTALLVTRGKCPLCQIKLDATKLKTWKESATLACKSMLVVFINLLFLSIMVYFAPRHYYMHYLKQCPAIYDKQNIQQILWED